MAIKITNDNYDTYKKVFEIIWRHMWKDFENLVPSTSNPVEILNRCELENKSIAKKGLQASLNDSLSHLDEFPEATLLSITLDLEKVNLPNLNTLRNIIKKTIDKVLVIKKIKNIDQYYIIKEVLDNTTSDISIAERNSLSTYLGDFEFDQESGSRKKEH